MKKTIDLGISGEGRYYGSSPDDNDYKKKHYPSLYISGVKMPKDLPEEFEAVVKLCKKTETIDHQADDEDGDTSSCSFEVKEMTVDIPQERGTSSVGTASDMGEVFAMMITEATK